MPGTPPSTRYVVVTAETERVAGAQVTAGSSCIHVHFHVRDGHLPVRVRADLLDTVFELPEIGQQRLLRASVPLGDAELLAALRHRCSSMDTRAAGATCLVDGVLVHRDQVHDADVEAPPARECSPAPSGR